MSRPNAARIPNCEHSTDDVSTKSLPAKIFLGLNFRCGPLIGISTLGNKILIGGWGKTCKTLAGKLTVALEMQPQRPSTAAIAV